MDFLLGALDELPGILLSIASGLAAIALAPLTLAERARRKEKQRQADRSHLFTQDGDDRWKPALAAGTLVELSNSLVGKIVEENPSATWEQAAVRARAVLGPERIVQLGRESERRGLPSHALLGADIDTL